jgi:anti-sigma factor RsiW
MSRFAMFPKSRRMMTCRRVGEQLQAYLDGEVDDLSARRIAHHLEDCRRCGMELEVYTEIKATLQRRAGGVDADALDRLRSFGQRLATAPDLSTGPGAEDLDA